MTQLGILLVLQGDSPKLISPSCIEVLGRYCSPIRFRSSLLSGQSYELLGPFLGYLFVKLAMWDKLSTKRIV